MSTGDSLSYSTRQGRTHRVRPFSIVSVICAFAIAAATVFASVAAQAAPLPVADFVRVDKSDRTLELLRDGVVLRTFPVALGFEPVGDKQEEGDNRTPEGRYFLDLRNPNSNFFLSIRISYPSAADVQRARERGVRPGGQIMIHGQPNTPRYSPAYYKTNDWTNGCIAVSNLAMIDIWLMTTIDTPIEIVP